MNLTFWKKATFSVNIHNLHVYKPKIAYVETKLVETSILVFW